MASIKQKSIRGNQPPFMNKDIRKAIMTRTRIRNRFLKEASPMNRLAFKKRITVKIKKQYYGFWNVNGITDNKNFRRVIKPNFSNKVVTITE